MRLVRDSTGQWQDEQGRPIVRRSISDQKRSKLRSYVRGLPDACLSGFDGLLTIWGHPWEVPTRNLKPSEIRKHLKSINSTVVRARTHAEILHREMVIPSEMGKDAAELQDLQRRLDDAQKLAAEMAQRLMRGKRGLDSSDAHAFVEQIDMILAEQGVSLTTSQKRGTDFVGLVKCLMEIAGFTPPERSGRHSENRMTRKYANTLVRAQVTRGNHAEAAQAVSQPET
jgi:hypothetical protein